MYVPLLLTQSYVQSALITAADHALLIIAAKSLSPTHQFAFCRVKRHEEDIKVGLSQPCQSGCLSSVIVLDAPPDPTHCLLSVQSASKDDLLSMCLCPLCMDAATPLKPCVVFGFRVSR